MRVAGKHRRYDDEGETNELMSESYSRRSWKGIAIAFLVMAAVAAIVTLIVVYSGSQAAGSLKGTLLLEDVVNGKYAGKGFSGVWVEGDKFIQLDDVGDLMQYDIPTNKTVILLDKSTWVSKPREFYPSPSNQYLIYAYNSSSIYRYSFNASYMLVHVQSDDKKAVGIQSNQTLQLISWGPNDQLVYVFENNIYYVSDVSKLSTPVQVTKDGAAGRILNGIPDWVYEEEVLGAASAVWWSTNGSNFAFIKFNDSLVNDMYFVHYGDYEQVYPSLVDIKYPKPGYHNPEVSMWVVNTSNPTEPVQVKPQDDMQNLTHYIYGAVWPSDDTLSVVWMPRTQNHSVISLCKESEEWNCSILSSDESRNGWVDGAVPFFAADQPSFFCIRPYKDNYKHLAYYNSSNKGLSFVTTGPFEVTSIVYYDSNNRTVYYIRTVEDYPGRRRFYKYSEIDNQITCLTCELEDCSWASVSIGSKGGHYAITCSDYLKVPVVRLVNLNQNEIVQVWENNNALKEDLKKQVLTGTPLNYNVLVGKFNVSVRVFTPADFSDKRRYGALIYVYGGPTSQSIQDRFGIDFGTYLASVKDCLYILVDGRGSGFRGNELLFEIYKKLGTVEIEDQITAMRYLLRNVTYVDPNKVAIWGWSYGGYAAAMTLAKGGESFKCAMSVAPVTSWTYYDSIYTERYMLQPSENLNSYKSSQLMNYVSNFKDKQFLLLHGTGDDNVHVQQSMMLIKALNNASIPFDMHLYPDESHELLESQLLVFQTLEQFLDKCFS